MRSSRSRKASSKRPIAIEDLLGLTSVGEPQISPDGRWLVVVRSVANEKQKSESSLWIMAADGRTPPRPLTHGPKDGQPRFAPDSRRLAFVRTNDAGAAQVATIDIDGGEARQLTRLPEGAFKLFGWSPDGKRLAIGHRTTEADWTSAAKKARERDGKGDPPRVIEHRWHRLDGDGWFGLARFALYGVDAASGAHKHLFDDTLGDFDVAWSPDGKRLAITTNRAKDAFLKPFKDEIVLCNVERGTIAPIKGLPIGPKTGITWSPDGRHLAWAGRVGRDSVYSTENLEIWAMPVDKAGASARSLTRATDYCMLAPTLSDSSEVAFRPTILWQNASTLLARVGWQGTGQLVAFALKGGAPRMLTSGAVDYVIGNVSRDGKRVAALRGAPDSPTEAGVLELGSRSARWRELSHFNVEYRARHVFAKPTSHWIKADDGHRTHVWVMRPPSGAREAKRGAIIEVHGGPHTQYGSMYFHEFQVLAAQGFVVVYSNPRGSKGYGRDHCAAIRGNWGDRDWADVQAVTRFAQSLSGVDAKRVGIMGGSYGGYMTNWAIAHSKAYRAAITDRCVSNLLSMAGNSDYVTIPGEYWPGTNYENPEPLWKQSPIAHFKGVSTPTLIIHSEGDLRCNIEQADQVHTALVLQGVPTRFVRYPASTSHGMSRSGPADMKIHRLKEIVAWMKRWL